MADLGSNHSNNECTGRDCRISGIVSVVALLITGLLLIPVIATLGFHTGVKGRPVMLSQGQTQIVEGIRDRTICSGLVLNITSNRTTVTLYRLSRFPHDADIDINSSITQNTIESCSAGRGYGQECTVSNDPSSTYVVTTSSGPPHERSVRVQVNCQFAGGSVAGIVIAILVVYTLFCAGLLVGIFCCARCIDNNSESNLKWRCGKCSFKPVVYKNLVHTTLANPVHHSTSSLK